MFRYKEVQLNYADIFRVFISGSSSAGKTHFANRLLKENLFDFERVYYFHPDFHETAPVDWSFNILYNPGLPTIDDLLAIPEKSCLIFDDLYHECVNSNVIDYLYRVLSSKRKLHCIVMTQRYFAQGKYALNIRNSSNYHILMRNADERTNIRAADSMNLKTEILKANGCNENEMYPYIIIDKTNFARVTGIKVYIELFHKYKRIIMKSNEYWLISARECEGRFNKIDHNVAIEHETPTKIISKSSESLSEKTEPRTGSTGTEPSRTESGTEPTSSTRTESTGTEPANSKSKTEPRSDRYKRRDFTRRVRQIVHRYKKRSVF